MSKLKNQHIRVHWLIGRGASIGCKLTWGVPWYLNFFPKNLAISFIKNKIHQKMNSPKIDTSSYQSLIDVLSSRTLINRDHAFCTTNWDYLLQRTFDEQGWKVQPAWLASSWVYHLNGTAEELADNSNRSPFLLEKDSWRERAWTLEANKAFDSMCWARFFIVIGISFECETDRFLLESLGRLKDVLPIGDSTWILVNPDSQALQKTASQIYIHLPYATVIEVNTTLIDWITQGMTELVELGILR